MQFVQILECSSTLGTCCGDYALASILDTCRRVVYFVQLIAPIVLIVMATIQLIKMVASPDNKKGLKPIFNMFFAAAIIFFVPMLVDASLGVLPDDFSLTACWETAKVMRESSNATQNRHISLNDGKVSKVLQDPSAYEGGDPSFSGSSSVSGVGAQRILNVALGEIGNHESNSSHHKYNAYGNIADSQPWCAAFVSWCAGQAGFIDSGSFPKFVGCTSGFAQFKSMGAEVHYANSGYTPRGGDIVFFSWTGTSSLDHVGIVISADANYVYTVEGNTSCEGEAKSKCAGSDGVSKKSRVRNNTIYAYVTPKYS